jgi:Short C-terminal domain
MQHRRIAVILALLLVPQWLAAASFNAEKEAKTADKGPYPWEYQSIARQFISDTFYDPSSVVDFEITKPAASWWRDAGFGGAKNRTTFCWAVLFTSNAKNRMGGYVGKQLWALYIRDARVIGHVQMPWNRQTEVNFTGIKARGEEEFREEWAKLSPDAQQKAQLLLESGAPEQQAKAPSYIDELKQLAALKEQGVITEEEFNAKKRQLLGLESPAAGESSTPKPPGESGG